MNRTPGSMIVAAIILIISLFTSAVPLSAQSPEVPVEELRNTAPKVFLDCGYCDRDYFREEITYVNWVRDRVDADVHVLMTDQSTGSGGREYTFAFIGLGACAGLDNTLTCASGPNDTSDEVRRMQVEVLERGLFPYVVKTPIAEFIDLEFREKLQPTSIRDPWRFWVFSVSADARLSGEESRSSKSLDMNFSANHVTPQWKVRLGLSADNDKRVYSYEEDGVLETITSISKEKDLSFMAVKSLSEHWSIGGWAEAESSTYGNVDGYFSLAPAIEYNVFPYSQSTRRLLLVRYRIGWNHANYIEETIYEKMEETLFNESLIVSLQIREPWGTVSASAEGSHYFHDLSKARLELRGDLSFRVFKGFSVEIDGRYDIIHDQLSLPLGDLSLDELLLQRKELATGFEYSISVGFSYTFGSVYSNVVNPRFGRTRHW